MSEQVQARSRDDGFKQVFKIRAAAAGSARQPTVDRQTHDTMHRAGDN